MMQQDPQRNLQTPPPKVLLVFPPQWTPQNPHFALTLLTGHLRSHGVEVKPLDLNIRFYAEILTREAMLKARDRAIIEHKYLEDKLKILSVVGEESLNFQLDGQKAMFIENYVEKHGDAFTHVPSLIDAAVKTLRDPEDYYDPDKFTYAMETIEQALEIYSLAYWPSRLQFNYFEQPLIPLNLDDILSFVKDEHYNMYRRFYAEQVPALAAERPDVLALSINAFSQILPGLTLAYELKKVLAPEVHLSIGGNFFTRLVENLRQKPAFFEHFCDSVSFGEGERPLLSLVNAVAAREPLADVPNLLYLTDDGTVKVTATCEPEPLETRGFHDFSDLPMGLYLTPTPVICLEASKGCYWGRCTFCDSFFGVGRDEASVDRVVDEIRHLKTKWGIANFEFADECMTPQYMEALADRLIAEKLDVRWFCNGRLERTFTKERLQKLYDGGLRLVLWGFESGSKRIMDLINKGVDFDERWQTLRDSTAVGIWNNAYIFYGFPTETKEEAEQTIRAICNNTDLIHSYGRSVFTLGKQSLLRTEAQKYGIVSVLQDNQEFSTNLYFKATGGLDEKEAAELMALGTRRAAAAYGGAPLWMYLRYRENVHLYICHHGRTYVQRHQLEGRGVTEFENVW